jgi:transposase InsO family protein
VFDRNGQRRCSLGAGGAVALSTPTPRRRELLDMESFSNLHVAQQLLDGWRQKGNLYLPHQSLAYQTPPSTRRWRTQTRPELS